MVEFRSADISEGIDVNKTNLLKECDICHYWYVKDISFNNIAIVYVKGSFYRIHFWHMSKDDAINIMNRPNLVDKRGVL